MVWSAGCQVRSWYCKENVFPGFISGRFRYKSVVVPPDGETVSSHRCNMLGDNTG